MLLAMHQPRVNGEMVFAKIVQLARTAAPILQLQPLLKQPPQGRPQQVPPQLRRMSLPLL